MCPNHLNSINPSLEIRCADEEDAEQISALYKRVWDEFKRRMGVGTALVEKVIEYAKENDSFKVWLDTAPFMSDAISLYERFGFKKSGYLQRHFWGLDVALYELVLKPQDHGDNDSM